MKATIKIAMNNDAFSDAPGLELGRILRELAERVENFGWRTGESLPAVDLNDNVVGELKITGCRLVSLEEKANKRIEATARAMRRIIGGGR